MMALVFKLLIALASWMLSLAVSGYQMDGKTMIGSILPLHHAGNSSRACSEINMRGIAASVAIRVAAASINTASPLPAGGGSMQPIGYDIRDSCGNAAKAKDIAYEFNIKNRAVSNASTKVTAVIAEFTMDEIQVSRVLSLERITQMSYYEKNVRLHVNNEETKREIGRLYSTYPEDISKGKVVRDLLETYHWQSVHVVAIDTMRGRDMLTTFKKDLEEITEVRRPCYTSHMTRATHDSVNATMLAILDKPLISVVVLFCNAELDLMLFEAAQQLNVTNIIWITTTNWQESLSVIQSLSPVIDGMIVIETPKTKSDQYVKEVYALIPPFDNDTILMEAFNSVGGASSCPVGNKNAKRKCRKATDKLKAELISFVGEASYAMDAVYAVYKSNEMITKSNSSPRRTLQDELRVLNSVNPLTTHTVHFNKRQVIPSTSYDIYNFQGNKSGHEIMLASGSWRSEGYPRLRLNKRKILWKNGNTVVPSSRCSLDCQQGTYLSTTQPGATRCCWDCVKCHTYSMSNVTNAKQCQSCPAGQVAIPDRTKCVAYKVEYFRWFRPSGEFLLVLVTAGLCVVMFTMGIFSQNSESEVVLAGNYKLMVMILAGVSLSFLCVVPLLLEPEAMVCKVFVGLFTASLTIPLAIMMTKSATVAEHFYDEDGDLKKATLGPRPRLVISLLVCLIQVVLVVAAITSSPPPILVSDTSEWNVKYVQCECLVNLPLWIGFVYNVILSLVVTFLSCSSTNADGNFGELQQICATTCMLFLDFFLFVAVTFGVAHRQLTLALGVLSCVFGGSILAFYFIPKLRLILCRKEKVIAHTDSQPLLETSTDAEPPKVIEKAQGLDASPGTKRRMLQDRIRQTMKENESRRKASSLA